MSYASYNEFIGTVKSQGILGGSHFSIILPTVGSTGTTEVSMLCEMAALPGINIMTSELRAFGEVTEYSYGITYPPVSLSFYLTGNFDTRAYFRNWMNQVYQPIDRTAGFYRDYVKPLKIILQDRAGKEVYSVVLHEAFPKTVSDISLSYSDHSPLKLNVTIQYKWWSNNSQDPQSSIQKKLSSSLGGLSNEGLSNFTGIARGLNVGGLASFASNIGLSLPTSISTALSDATNLFNSNPFLGIGAAMAQNGPTIGGNILSEVNSCVNAIKESNIVIPGQGPRSGSIELSTITRKLGTGFGEFGGNLAMLGKNLQQLTAPAAALRGSINSIANTTNQLNSLANALGIKNSGLSKVSSQLLGASAQLNKPLIKLGDVTGSLTGMGTGMIGIDTGLTVISNSIEALPGATRAVSDTLARLGNIIGIHSNNINNTASELSNLDGL
jgi:hypothetical protein